MDPSSISKILRGYKICLTGFSKMDLLKSINNINRLGGTYMEKTVSDATCMVVNRVGGKDFQSCFRMNIPLVSVTWLHDCLRQNKAMKMNSYPVKPFTGLSITCTQLDPTERLKLQQLVEDNGGKYNVQLVRDSATHLVAKEASGEKFSYAKLWNNVHVISMGWIEECARSKAWVPESDYSIVPPLQKKSKKFSGSKNTKERPKSPEKSVLAPIKPPDEVVLMNSNTVIEQLDRILRSKKVMPLFPTTCLPVDKETVFAREFFFVDGFHSQITDYIVRLILWGGGHRCMILNQTVTTVLIGDLADKSILSEIERHPYGVQFVNMTWLMGTIFGFKKVVEIARTETPFKELTESVDFDRIESLKDMCDYQKFAISKKVADEDLQQRCLSTGTLHSSLDPDKDHGDFPAAGGDSNRSNDIMSYDGDTAFCALELELEILRRRQVPIGSSSSSSSGIFIYGSNDLYDRPSKFDREGKAVKLIRPSNDSDNIPSKRVRREFPSRDGTKNENAVNYSSVSNHFNSNQHSSSGSSSNSGGSSSSLKAVVTSRGLPQINWQQISPTRLCNDFPTSDLASFHNNRTKMRDMVAEEEHSRSFLHQHAEESQIVIYKDIPGKLL